MLSLVGKVSLRDRPDDDEDDEHGDQPEVADLDGRPSGRRRPTGPVAVLALLRTGALARCLAGRARRLILTASRSCGAPFHDQVEHGDSSSSSAGASCMTRPSAQHEHPVGEAEHLGHLAGDEQDTDAASRRAADEP